MNNREIANIFFNIADMLELQEVKWRPQAYRKVAMSIESLSEDLKDIYKKGELRNIPGVGEAIEQKISELVETGKLQFYEKLKKEVKVNIEELKSIPGLGPKKIKVLYKELGIKNIKDLEKAIKQGKLHKLKGFGEETVKNFVEGIKFVKTNPKRFLISQVLPLAEEIKQTLHQLPEVQKVEIAGSLRRGKETIGDLDILVVSKQAGKVMDIFTSLPKVTKILAKGPTKSSIRLDNLQVDLRVVKAKEFGSAMNYFTGSKEHNVALRQLALKKGLTLNEYGLNTVKEKKWVAGRSEEDIYKKLGMAYIPPELRTNRGEIQAAQKNRLPNLITSTDIQGVFHNHTTWSDGKNSHLEMAQKAEELGLRFMSFNDHYGPVGIANPINEKRLGSYLKEIEKVRKEVGIRIYSGLEIDILKNGKLALPTKYLKDLDVVIASVHIALKMNEQEMTKRVCTAMEDYPIHILGHPTDRLLNIRAPLPLNLDKVFQTAKQTNTFLEINSQPKRMDLPGEHIKSAKEIGCQFALSTDAHSTEGLDKYRFGVLSARRGWLEKKDVLNCWNLKKMEKTLGI